MTPRQERAKRAGWGLADQLVASGSNLALSLTAVRALDPNALGAFAIVFAVYLFALNLGRAAIAQPLIARHSHCEHDTWHRALTEATGTALLAGTAGGLVLAIVGFTLGDDLGPGLLALGVLLPGLLIQDALRYAFFAANVPFRAFVVDAIWAALAVPALLWMAFSPPVPVAALVGAWGVAGCLAAGAGLLVSRARPQPLRTRAWLRAHRAFLPALVGGTLLEVAAQTLTTAGIGALAGLRAAGALRVGQLLLSPAFFAYQASALVVPPEAARLARTNPHRLLRLLARTAALLALVIAGSAIVILLIPPELGRDLLPANWDSGHVLVAPLAVAMIGQVGAFAAATILLVLASMRRAFRMSVLSAISLTVTQLVGARLAGAPGVAVALAGTYPCLATAAWLLARRAGREASAAFTGDAAPTPSPGDAAQTASTACAGQCSTIPQP